MLTFILHTNRWPLWRSLLPFLLGALLVTHSVGHARAQGRQQITVTLRDAANRGLDQVVVALHEPGGAMLAEGVTARDGIVRLALSTSATTFRLSVRGVTATGRPLQFAPTERNGIAVRVNGQETTIALRVEDDGTVLPDPATMAEAADVPHTSVETVQPSALATIVAEAPALPTVVLPSASPVLAAPTAQPPAPVEFVDANGQPITEAPSAPSGLVSSLVFLLILTIVAGGIWRILRPVRGGQR